MTKNNIHTLILSAAFISIFAAIFLISITNQKKHAAPDISFLLLDGNQVKLSEQLGRPVLITFWASTCHLCLQEIPDLIALYEEMKMTDLEIIGVAMPYDPPNRVLEIKNIMGITYPVALDIHGEIVDSFGGVSATPTAFLISPEGTVVTRYTGQMDMHKLRMQIFKLNTSKSEEENVTRETAFSPLLNYSS